MITDAMCLNVLKLIDAAKFKYQIRCARMFIMTSVNILFHTRNKRTPIILLGEIYVCDIARILSPITVAQKSNLMDSSFGRF